MSLFPPIGPTESKKYLKFGRERAEGRRQRQKLYEEKYMTIKCCNCGNNRAPSWNQFYCCACADAKQQPADGAEIESLRATYAAKEKQCDEFHQAAKEFQARAFKAEAKVAELEKDNAVLTSVMGELKQMKSSEISDALNADRLNRAEKAEAERDAWKAKAEKLTAALESARESISCLGIALSTIAESAFESFEDSGSNEEAGKFGAIANTANFARTLYEDPALAAITALLAPDVAKLGEDIA